MARVTEVIDMVSRDVHAQPFSAELTEQANNEPGAVRDVAVDVARHTECCLRFYICTMKHRILVLIRMRVTVQISHICKYIRLFMRCAIVILGFTQKG